MTPLLLSCFGDLGTWIGALGAWACAIATGVAALFAGLAFRQQSGQLKELSRSADEEREERRAALRAVTPDFLAANDPGVPLISEHYPKGIPCTRVVWNKRDKARWRLIENLIRGPEKPLQFYFVLENRLKGTDPIAVQVRKISGPENAMVDDVLEEAIDQINSVKLFTLQFEGMRSAFLCDPPIPFVCEFWILTRTGHIVKKVYEFRFGLNHDRIQKVG